MDGPWDHLLVELQELRRRAGEPSYAELARRVCAQRVAAGADEHAARLAKSTVHDAFRLGRARINLSLTRELVAALGADPGLVDAWLARPAEPQPEPEPDLAPEPVLSAVRVVVLLSACVALNLLGREFVDLLRLPVYLDMVGTAVAAVSFGPWRGAAVGLATNVLGVVGSGWVSLPFAVVNVIGALVLGYGVHRWGMGRTLPRFFALCVGTAVVCSAVAVPVIALVYGHTSRVGHDAITELLVGSLGPFWLALTFSNLLTSLADKIISGFVALVVVACLPLGLRRHLPLATAPAPAPGPVRARARFVP